jgi:GNAT superfamily N-acetyltransferase
MEKEHIKPAALMCNRAFKDEFIDIFPDPKEREHKSLYAHEFFLRRDYAYNVPFITSPKVEGIAIWIHSDKWEKRKFWRIITSGAIWQAMKIGCKATRKINKFEKYIEEKHKELVPNRHWYLSVLAVDPKYQGKGFGSKLVKEMLARIDKEGLPCYVETEGEKNVSMYRRFGFKVLEEFTIPDTKDTLVAMLREPVEI